MMEILGTVATLYGIEVSSRSSAKSLSAPYTASLAYAPLYRWLS
jgi:hypothetical protein